MADEKKPIDPGNRFLNVDPLRGSYRERVVETPDVFNSIKGHKTALLVIDLQLLDAMPGVGIFADLEKSGIPPEAQDYYFYQLRRVVLPNVRRLQDRFRELGMEVIHTRIQSLTQDGRDRSPGHKRLELLAPPGSKEAEFLPEVAPIGDEIVINKTASGVFSSTNLEFVLRNMEITGLFVVGVFTNECVSTTVRDGCDLGFHMTMMRDACAAVTPELQRSTLFTLKDRYTRILTTDEALAELDDNARPG